MISPCGSATYRANAGVLLAALCLGVAATPPAAAAAAAMPGDALLQPTPLILKDGRIAEVSVHVVPFQSGRPEVVPAAAGELAGITRAVATDCFLTAQVIGHVAPSEVAENDSLAAHRLARSRADAIQASLIGGGLPAKAIASVWDWQFLVPEPRATLWLFRLTEGEDCDGTPLAPGTSELVAEAETGTPAAQPASTPQADDAATRSQPEQAAAAAPPATVAQPAPQPVANRATTGTPPAAERDTEGTAQIRQAEHKDAAKDTAATRPEPGAVPAGPALAEAATRREMREVPATSPAQTSGAESAQKPPADRTTVARATPATRPTPSSRPPAASAAPMAAEDGLAITFATNSSYFPPGTSKQLRSLIRGIAAGERYRVVLQASVSGSDKVVGASTPEEARRYNRWLAERRVERVQTWLNENAVGADLVIEPQYLPGHEERTVVVRVAPAA